MIGILITLTVFTGTSARAATSRPVASCFAYIELAACSESSRARTLACSVELVAGPPVTPRPHGAEDGVRAAHLTAAKSPLPGGRGGIIHLYLTPPLSESDA